MRKIIFILSVIMIYACNTATTVGNTSEEPKLTTSKGLEILPLLPKERRKSLLENTDYIDYIFYPYGTSVNQGDKGSVRKMIGEITDLQQPDVNCAVPFCKVTFYKMPNILLEAEVHYGNGCAYFVFHNTEGKPEFANKIGNFGIQFFNDIIKRFEQK